VSGLYHGYGEIIKTYKTIKPKKSMCSGCYCDDYNYGLGGERECWSFKDAKVVDKSVHRDIYFTKKFKVKKTLSCYHAVNK